MTAPTSAAAPGRLASRTFADDEPVYTAMSGQLPGVAGPVFGRVDEWPCDCLRRPANRKPHEWKCSFPLDPVWNLRAREVAFCMLNPHHRALRDAGIFPGRKIWSPATARKECICLATLGAWAVKEGMPDDLQMWATEDWQGYIDHRASSTGPESVRSAVGAVRRLVRYSGILTGTGVLEDPWPGKTDSEVAKLAASDNLSTPSIPPEVWWPLLRAAWAYIDRFSADILDRRDRERDRLTMQDPSPRGLGAGSTDSQLQQWLADPANLVPLNSYGSRSQSKGAPIWALLSRSITGGASKKIFEIGRAKQGVMRRSEVLRMIEETGRVETLDPPEVRRRVSQFPAQVSLKRSRQSLDDTLHRWLADPTNVIPVHANGSVVDRAGEPVWSRLEELVLETPGQMSLFNTTSQASQLRREAVLHVLAMGTHQVVSYERKLILELHMLRAACYIFVAALSAMRDSEIQEIQRGALTQHYGAPAIGSRKVKGDSSTPKENWWIIEPVAQTLAVAERLSWHDTHLFTALGAGRVGIKAVADIDLFIAQVNANRHLTGLKEIPSGRVRPHMFRRTMSIIASQQPDGEIAVGIQLKHAARRALANRLSGAYGQIDAKWAKEFDTDLQTAAARKLVGLLKARRSGGTIAVGPGAARFHAGLDKVNAAIAQTPTLRAEIADERLEITLLRDEFADFHLGTVNHCMWNAPTAECQNQLPPAQRGQAPLLGACQPSRCRNSVLTLSHERIWRMEEADLVEFLKKKLSKPLRDQALARLAEVRSATQQIDRLKENA
ncbi:hypothetical protein OOK39_37945 [Streptomyces sp. NBC_00264]|uniref:hypothetical protein n=1 Tax=unclassified Streptomyces TaxID=2593676 RepID=UPI000F5BB79C|nr:MULTISPECIES: hypothetical protein [unclassified Streptomyces]WSG55201.1 hypothetical protein OHA38_38230 [Streptomyces sp. NBC_01732]MCX5165004.1 hypothetical protein [Streptomyces sp. NBC_00305]MCX5223528.1 hypothetical protein [Streptomyces sp. NBC_00264]RPK67156.1 hypothetical protein EES42_23040 [Streptomyces sp. ADI95-17]WSC32652.1 hypothetical protein OG902_41500 [Streptomyces sp. NBC_01768]